MPKRCPPPGADPSRPPDLPPSLVTLFKNTPSMAADVFRIGCLTGDAPAATAGAWILVENGEADTRDAILRFVVEEIGFADVALVDRMRRIWGAVRPQGPWAPPIEWPDMVETIEMLCTARTGTIATDLLAYSLYPFERPSRIEAMWAASLEDRAKVLANPSEPLVNRLAAALAMADGLDPRWSHCEEPDDGATPVLLSTLTGLPVPVPLVDGIEYAIRGGCNFPAIAHALVYGELAEAGAVVAPILADPTFPALAANLRAAWALPSGDPPVLLPSVLGLPLHAFHWRTELGAAGIGSTLRAEPDLIDRLAALSPADPAEIVDTTIERATRRLATRALPVPSIPDAAELGDLGLFCRVGVAPHEVPAVIGLVRPILPMVARTITSRLVVLH